MRYRTRRLVVEAIQWTGGNLEEVRAICPGAYTVDSGWTLAIPLPDERRIAGLIDHLTAHVGWYVVRRGGESCAPVMPSIFEAHYEAVTDESAAKRSPAEASSAPRGDRACADEPSASAGDLRNELTCRNCRHALPPEHPGDLEPGWAYCELTRDEYRWANGDFTALAIATASDQTGAKLLVSFNFGCVQFQARPRAQISRGAAPSTGAGDPAAESLAVEEPPTE